MAKPEKSFEQFNVYKVSTLKSEHFLIDVYENEEWRPYVSLASSPDSHISSNIRELASLIKHSSEDSKDVSIYSFLPELVKYNNQSSQPTSHVEIGSKVGQSQITAKTSLSSQETQQLIKAIAKLIKS